MSRSFFSYKINVFSHMSEDSLLRTGDKLY